MFNKILMSKKIQFSLFVFVLSVGNVFISFKKEQHPAFIFVLFLVSIFLFSELVKDLKETSSYTKDSESMTSAEKRKASLRRVQIDSKIASMLEEDKYIDYNLLDSILRLYMLREIKTLLDYPISLRANSEIEHKIEEYVNLQDEYCWEE